VQVFGELSPRQKRIEVVRWLLLVPAALLASSTVTFIIGAFVRVIRGSSVPLNSSSISFWACAVPFYVLPEFVFVIAGGWIAPRKQLPVALLLMLVGGVLSFLKHVVVQHLAGHSLGPTNYTHFGLEMAGLLAGVVCIRRLKIVPHGIERQ
jgi:Na+-driven multidrug efflux pump